MFPAWELLVEMHILSRVDNIFPDRAEFNKKKRSSVEDFTSLTVSHSHISQVERIFSLFCPDTEKSCVMTVHVNSSLHYYSGIKRPTTRLELDGQMLK